MLTDKTIRALRPTDKPRKVADGRGMYLLVRPNGSRLWRFKYRFDGRENVTAIGAYPEIGLADARERRDELRRLLSSGIDPAARRKATRVARSTAAENSLEVVAREWFQKMSPGWVEKHRIKIIQRLERDVFPWVGSRPVAEVTAPEVLAVLRRIEERGANETARRALGDLSAVCRYAVATGRAVSDPCRDLRGALAPKVVRHFAAVTEPKAIPDLLRAIDGYQGGLVVRSALRLAPLLFVRPGELRSARWADIDLEAGEWRFTASKTKQPHIVPLATQAVAILRELCPLTGRRDLVFPGARSAQRPMSENTINVALRSLGIGREVTSGHGFRAMARTVLDEHLRFPAHLIEAQLAHAVRDANGRSYNRTTHIDERRAMMQRWADYLDLLRESNVGRVDVATTRPGFPDRNTSLAEAAIPTR
jgi:integrase